jgi:hypothetical protein
MTDRERAHFLPSDYFHIMILIVDSTIQVPFLGTYFKKKKNVIGSQKIKTKRRIQKRTSTMKYTNNFLAHGTFVNKPSQITFSKNLTKNTSKLCSQHHFPISLAAN